jgi:hypothetical protein
MRIIGLTRIPFIRTRKLNLDIPGLKITHSSNLVPTEAGNTRPEPLVPPTRVLKWKKEGDKFNRPNLSLNLPQNGAPTSINGKKSVM